MGLFAINEMPLAGHSRNYSESGSDDVQPRRDDHDGVNLRRRPSSTMWSFIKTFVLGFCADLKSFQVLELRVEFRGFKIIAVQQMRRCATPLHNDNDHGGLFQINVVENSDEHDLGGMPVIRIRTVDRDYKNHW